MRRLWGGLSAGAALGCLAIVLSSARPAGSAAPPGVDAYPAVYQDLEVEHRIAANGGEEEIRRATVRIQSEIGADLFGRITIPMRSPLAEVRVVSASVRPAAGSERRLDPVQLEQAALDASEFRVYSVPGVHMGDEIVSEIHVLYAAPGQAQWWMNLAPVVDLPVRRGKWTVAIPRGVELSTDVFKDTNHRETEAGVHVWQLSGAAADEAPAPWFGVSTFATWNEVGEWLRSLEPSAPDADVRAEARRLAAGKPKAAVVEALYARVAQGVRLLDRPLSNAGFKSRAPKETLAEGAGDAISKHVLLASLLGAQGVQADAVFVSGASALDIDFPSPGQLAYVVTTVEDGKQAVWLDSSLDVARAGALPPELRGRRGLLVSQRGSRIVQVPPAPAGFNHVRAAWSGKLDAKGKVEAELRVELRGDTEAMLRRAFRDGGAAAEALLRRLLMPPFATPAGPVTHSPVFDLRGPLVVEAKATILEFLQPLTRRAGSRFRAFNYGQDCQCTPAPAPQPDPPVLKPPYTVEESFDLTLPENVRPILPPPTLRNDPAGSVRSSTEFADGALHVRRTVEVRSDEGADGQKFAASVMFDLSRSQVFEHTGDIDVDAVLKDRSDSDLDSQGYEASNRDTELALVILEYATRRNPQSRYAWNNLGRMYEKLGRREDALKAYDRQIEVNPKDEWAYSNRGEVLSHMKRHQEAISWFERQLQIDPNSQYALRNIGHSYVETAKWPEAETYLKRALAASAEDTEVLVDLGQARSCQGDLAGGKVYFERAVRGCPPAASQVASVLSKCGVGLAYARDQAESALKMTQMVFDATRGLSDWSEGVGAQLTIAASLEALAEVLLKTNRAADAAPLLDAAAAMAADEDLSLDKRDAQIALGNLGAAAQAHVDAQQLAGGRKLEVPNAIAALVGQVTSGVDADGWRRLEIRRSMRNTPQAATADRQVVLACAVSEAGAVGTCTALDGDASLVAAALRDVTMLKFPRVNWRGKPERITRLIRLVYQADGGIEAFEAASMSAMAQVRRLMPSEKKPED